MNTLLDQFKQHKKRNGKPVVIDGISTTATFKENEDNENSYDTKYIFTDLGLIKQGSIIEALGQQWISISQSKNINDVYDKSLIKQVNYNINFNFDGNIISFPAIVDSRTFDIETGKYISLPEGKISVTLQDNIETRNIVLQQRFLSMKQAFEVVGIDRTKIGLLILECDVTCFNANDDKQNEIADRWKYEVQHNYVVSIVNGESVTIEEESTLQLDILVTDNGNIISMPVIYTLSDETIATVDENGLITAIAQGDCVIQVALQEDNSINDTISITVEQVQVVDNYSITITGADSITIGGNTETYTAKVYNNNVLVNDKSVTWSIDNTTYATIQSQTGNSCVVKSYDGYSYGEITLTATLVDYNSITGSKNIEIVSLF